eukprot:g42084.t1
MAKPPQPVPAGFPDQFEYKGWIFRLDKAPHISTSNEIEQYEDKVGVKCPEMVYLSNALTIEHPASNLRLRFDTRTALLGCKQPKKRQTRSRAHSLSSNPSAPPGPPPIHLTIERPIQVQAALPPSSPSHSLSASLFVTQAAAAGTAARKHTSPTKPAASATSATSTTSTTASTAATASANSVQSADTQRTGSSVDTNMAVRSVVETIKVAGAWSADTTEGIPEVVEADLGYDWTYTTRFSGLAEKIASDLPSSADSPSPTTAGLNVELLTRPDPILWYHAVDLYEDELHDNGVAKLALKVRVMPACFLLLLRFWLRVDNVLLRIFDTRLYHEFGAGILLKECTEREDSFEQLKARRLPTQNSLYRNPDEFSKHITTRKETKQAYKITNRSS